MSNSKYCGKPLYWQDDDSGAHIPYEDEAHTIQHKCQSYKKPQASLVSPLTDDEILWVRNVRATLKLMKK
jgi:hypothetical protein